MKPIDNGSAATTMMELADAQNSRDVTDKIREAIVENLTSKACLLNLRLVEKRNRIYGPSR